jgi:SAM-dependent methyltransferase
VTDGAARLVEHRRIWESKPVLSRVYAVWFDALLASLPPQARVLEVGAGPGFLSAHARGRAAGITWVATELLETPWNDVVADGLRLPFRPGTFDAVVALDLVHHLARPAAFFAEAARILRPRGRIAVIEPWVSPLSYPIYRWLHQEGCTLGIDPWDPFARDAAEGKDPFRGDAAVLWRLVRDTPAARWRELGFRPPSVTRLNGFAYIMSLGFREGSLLPAPMAALLMKADRALAPLARYAGMRVLAVWEKEDRPSPDA